MWVIETPVGLQLLLPGFHNYLFRPARQLSEADVFILMREMFGDW